MNKWPYERAFCIYFRPCLCGSNHVELWPAWIQEIPITAVWGVSPNPVEDAGANSLVDPQYQPDSS